MTRFSYTLLADGTSDRCLVHMIDWILSEIPAVAPGEIVPRHQFVNLKFLPHRPENLARKIRQAIHFFPCDILFVHRDAEREPPENRLREIAGAADDAGVMFRVPVVPVRMTEAWMLIDERAIRRAADNPNGRTPLSLPRLKDVESCPDPKETLNTLLITASEKTGRRLARFRQDIAARRGRVADLINDFTPLLQLSAFRAFKAEAERVVAQWQRKRAAPT